MTLVILGCALPGYGAWWPFFVTIFYLLAPMPYILSRRYDSESMGSNACKELSLFLTSGLVISAYALPCVLAHSHAVSNCFSLSCSGKACYFDQNLSVPFANTYTVAIAIF